MIFRKTIDLLALMANAASEAVPAPIPQTTMTSLESTLLSPWLRRGTGVLPFGWAAHAEASSWGLCLHTSLVSTVQDSCSTLKSVGEVDERNNIRPFDTFLNVS